MSVYIPVDLQRRVRSHFAERCAYCQTAESLTVAIFEIEHITPRSAQGETVFENLCLACPTCNRFKSNRQTAVDPLDQETVPLFHPQQQRWQDHFVWNEAATEIVGLTPVGRATVAALKMNRLQLVRVRRMWVKMDEHPPKTV
ncbi:MAG: HNH endonuclease [Anaerolineaceae bacterium]|nr:HNH endonuclease [Anaerolineaceae bacterium]MCB9101581.1 HNH endonuclease [Anaerolineales bacterium]